MEPLKGYPKLASIVGQYPGMAIFRRFARLNAQNLLYMQVEIAQLEEELDFVVLQDSQVDERKSYQAYVHDLKKGTDSPLWQKAMEVRGRLKDYSM